MKVFDFHPIHVYLNTERLERYTSFCSGHLGANIANYRNNDGYGVETFMLELIEKGCL